MNIVDALAQMEITESIVQSALALMTVADPGSEEQIYTARQAWQYLEKKGLCEQLHQLLFSGPVYDGDVISKSGRDQLLKLKLAVRCCVGGEQGYTAASYSAYTVYRCHLED